PFLKARRRELVAQPRWASVNRGVLICDECCSVHRSLGRHSSQVRHLTQTPWPPSQLQMVQTVYSNGSNSIWEHSILDPASGLSGKRKTNLQDKQHPNKMEFIKAKYQMLAFVHRMPCREDDSSTTKDLSKQLHSSVRTGNLETCLRLLSLGAQANFFHPEKGNTPLHVAAKAGQVCQVELLTVYGADPGAPDSNGKTPIDYARESGHHDLADRLVEIQYELTDRLAFYLCGRKPDHKNGQHFIVPQMADSSVDLSELAKAAKRKLQSLSNHLFEELAMDVYDEVDRRETDAVWLATQNHSTLVTETAVVPFLPVNPEYSSTRNQGRQKLARFNAHEFATLVIDILSEAKRRQLGNSAVIHKDSVELILKSVAVRHCSDSQDTDQPDYDSVASDEDTDQELLSSKGDRTKVSLDSDLSDGPISMQEYMEVKNALSASEAKVQQLMKVNNNLNDELRLMQKKLQSLQNENTSLRRQVTTNIYPLKRRQSARANRPMSMYETSSGLKPYLPKGESHYTEEGVPTLQPFSTKGGAFVTTSSSLPSFPSTPSWLKEDSSLKVKYIHMWLRSHGKLENPLGFHFWFRSSGWLGEASSIPELEDADCDPTLPSTEDVIRKTEQITKNIQELLRAAQESKHDSFIPCSERIHLAVTEMAALFPKKPRLETVRGSLRLLTSSACRLQNECRKVVPSEGCPGPDMQLVTQQVIQCAYDIAKAAKQLVTITTKENNN
uniref:G protein-coupled receptor kinase interacting ArfGAP 2a n=1 Tax=Oryzias sinensis TaxID=183150 RepID=A0A8C8DUA6_9TELE